MDRPPSEILSGRYDSVFIYLKNWSYAYSKEIVRIKSVIQFAKEKKLPVRIKPPANKNVKDYVGRMDLFKGFRYEYPHEKHESDRFFPIYEVTNDTNEILFDRSHTVFAFAKIPSNYINELADVFTELSDNVYYHSGPVEKSGKGFAHAQAYSENINIAIDDCGVGFLGSYKRTNQVRFRSEIQIIEGAFEEMESSLNTSPKSGNRGLGLFTVKEFIKKYGGKITVISGSSLFCIEKDDIIKEKLPYQYDGTNIVLEVPIV